LERNRLAEKVSLFLAVAALTLTACGGEDPPSPQKSDPDPFEPEVVAPVIGDFSAPAMVGANEIGEALALLEWSGVERATRLVLESTQGEPVELEPEAEGQLEIRLRQDATLTLVASNEAGEARRERDVRVVPLPSIVEFAADRTLVGTGEAVQLWWQTEGASAIELWQDGARVTAVEPEDSSATLSLLLDSTVELRAFNDAGGMVGRTIELQVGPPELLDFQVSATSLWLSDTLHLSWTSKGASELEVVAAGIDEPICTTGNLQAMEESSCEWTPEEIAFHELTLVLTNGSGVVSETRPLFVGDGPVISEFVVEPAAITEGDPISLRWAGLPDPDGEEPAFTITDDRGNTYDRQGAQEIPAGSGLGTYLFTARAETSSPRSIAAEATAELVVHGVPTATLVAVPEVYDEVEVDEVELRWTSGHADTLILYRLGGELPVLVEEIPAERRAAGSYAFVPREDLATYRLVATNALGVQAAAEATVSMAPPQVLRFDADMEEVVMGQPVELSWDSKMGDEVDLDLVRTGYIRGETTEPYLDIASEGGTFLPLSGECFPGGSIVIYGCARLGFPLTFAFPFDGESQTAIRVYNSGFLSFDEDRLESSFNSNGSFPTSAIYDFVHLAPFWDRLSWDRTRYPNGNVYYLFREAPTGDSLVIQWKDATFENSPHEHARLNFEIILWENGDFEYRYGEMEPAPGASAAQRAKAEGSEATIGFQTPSRTAFDTLRDGSSIPLWGSIYGRSFLFRKAPPIARSGSYLWHPFATGDRAEATLSVRRGQLEDQRTVSVVVHRRPEISLEQFPTEPLLVGEGFRIGWTTEFATSFEILDQEGVSIYSAPDANAVREGFILHQEAQEGRYRYRLRAVGALGFAVEKTIEVTTYEPFGIARFEADSTVLEHGDVLRLEWETTNASTIRLLADGVDILPAGTVSGPGELILEDIEDDTTFVLQVENTVGMVIEESIDVQMWKVRIDLTASSTRIRPGDPVTIQVDATDLAGGTRPVVYGAFPMEAVEGAPFVDISTHPDAYEIRKSTESNVGADADFPPGFSFPYFGKSYTSFRAFSLGYVSFSVGALGSSSNRRLPDSSSGVFGAIHLAPFWDNLHARDLGVIWGAQIDPDTFVIQWKSMSHATGSSNTNRYDLNFQVVLHRDGSFEYRYGTMAPPPTPNASCKPESCEAEANASSATIGYQMPGGTSGFTFHLGDETQGYPGGLSNRSFRYEPSAARTEFTVSPTLSTSYTYCVEWNGKTVCQTLDIDASFGLDFFRIDEERVDFGQAIKLFWVSHGATKLEITDGDGVLLYSTSDLSEIDAGEWSTTPVANTSYTIVVEAPGNHATATTSVEVVRMALTASLPATTRPGVPITLSWNLQGADPALRPVVLAPMEEVGGLPFSELDISADPQAELIHGANVITAVVPHTFQGGFTFEYLGTEMSKVHISSAGYLSFDFDSTVGSASNSALPNDTLTARRIHVAPFWEALHTRTNGRVLARLVRPDTYVIQWSGTSVSAGSTASSEYSLNFMVVLHRNGDFEFRYGTMAPPVLASSSCNPNSCENEANGSSATIGYQDPTGTAGFQLHYESTASRLRPVPGGLSGRTWKFTRRSTSGTMQVAPWDDDTYRLCVRDGVTGDLACADPLDVEVDWGIRSFSASDSTPRRGGEVVLSWDVEGLDSLTVLAGDTPILQQVAPASQGTISQSPTEDTTYSLVGQSLGRVVTATQEIRIRTFELDVVEPTGRYFPGDAFPISWTATPLEAGLLSLSSPMYELDAGPGQPGEYRDISTETGAVERGMSQVNTGFAEVEIPFAFPYFGESFQRLRIHVDGYITFDLTGGAGVGSNVQLPSDTTANRRVHLAPFWDDFNMRGSDAVWTHQPDAQTFIIQWKSFNLSTGSSAPASLYDMNFQVVLHADGRFDYRYGAMTPPAQAAPSGCFPCTDEVRGSSATIGYQTVDGQVGTNLHYGTGQPFSGGLERRAFRFEPKLTGSTTVRTSVTTEFEICGQMETFRDCRTVVLRPVADPGDLMITELMIDPAGGTEAQWFELRNLTGAPVDLDGFVIENEKGSHRITGPVPVPPGGFAVLAAGPSAVVSPTYVYAAQIALDRQVDTLALVAGDSTIASASWGGTWFIPAGASLALDPSQHWRGTVSNDSFDPWCNQGFGSPGALGLGCMNGIYDVDPAASGTFHDISAIGRKWRAFETASSIIELEIPGLAFPFFSGSHDRLWVGSNGWISFADTLPSGGSSSPPSASSLPRSPTSNPRGPLIAAFWDLLRCDPFVYECAFHSYFGELGGEDLLVLQWSGFRRSSGVGSLTFQAQLAKNGDIRIVFGEVSSPDAPGSSNWNAYHGGSAWIGVEDVDPQALLTGHLRRPIDLGHRTFSFRRK